MAEALKNWQDGGEAAQGAGEIIDIQEIYRKRGEKILAAARVERPERKENERVLIDDKVDRLGNKAYNERTLEALQEKGVEQDPAEAEEAERLELARAASAAERKAKVIEVLNGRSPEYAIQEMQSDIGKWQAEIQQIEAETPTEGGKLELAHDQAMVKEMQARIALIESLTEQERAELDRELGTDVIVDTYEDGTVDVREAMPVTTAMADEDFAAEVAKSEGPIDAELAPATMGAAGGELDINSPLNTDEWKVRRQAVEILKNTEGMPVDVIAKVERVLAEAEERALRGEGQSEGLAQTSPEEMAMGPQAEDIELVPTAQVESAVDRGEVSAEGVNRVELQAKVHEKIQKRPSLGRRIQRKAAAVLLTAMAATAALSGGTMTAYAANATNGGGGGGSRIEAALERGASTVLEQANTVRANIAGEKAVETVTRAAENGTARFVELVGDLNTDNRYEAENGTRYRYDEFDSTEKHGKHGFGTDKSEFYGDIEGTRQEMLEINHAQPETLAATVVGYPGILQEAGLDANITARELDDMLSNQDGGGELQAQLFQILEERLNDVNTEFVFHQEYGQQYSYYIKNVLGDGELSTPENLELGQSLMQRNGEKQVTVRIPVYSEYGTIDHYDEQVYNLPCGIQPSQEVQVQQVKQMKQEAHVENAAQVAMQRAAEQAEQEYSEQPTWVNVVTVEEDEPGSEKPDEKQPDEKQPDEEQPDEEQPGEEQPGEEKAPKNGENQIKNATEGTTNEVTQTVQDGEVTEQHEVAENNAENKTEGAQGDATASAEEQAAAAAAQEEANASEQTESLTDQEYVDYNNNFEERAMERQAEEADAAAEAAAGVVAEEDDESGSEGSEGTEG